MYFLRFFVTGEPQSGAGCEAAAFMNVRAELLRFLCDDFPLLSVDFAIVLRYNIKKLKERNESLKAKGFVK